MFWRALTNMRIAVAIGVIGGIAVLGLAVSGATNLIALGNLDRNVETMRRLAYVSETSRRRPGRPRSSS